MSNIASSIRLDRQRKDGTCPVYLNFRLENGERIRKNTNVYVLPSDWDADKSQIRGRSKDVKDQNLILNNDKAFITDIIVRYKLTHTVLTEKLFNAEWENRASAENINVYILKKIEERIQNNEIANATAISHKALAKDMRAFRNPISFFDIDEQTMKKFVVYLQKNGNNANTIDKKMRQLHAYFSIAIRDNLIKFNPVDLLTKHTEASIVEYLVEDELKRLINMYNTYEMSPRYRAVLRKYLFACATGLRISDVQTLEHRHLKDGYIVKMMKKTKRTSGRLTRIPITPFSQSLIDEATQQGSTGTDLVFTDGIADQDINSTLKELAIMAGIPKRLNFKTGRHTFGYLYYKKTKDLLALQRLMGHSKIEQTLIYAHLNDEDIISGMTSYADLFK